MAEDIHNFVLIFASIVWEAFPFIVIGAMVSGLLEEFVPQKFILKLLPKQQFLSIVLAAHIGLVFPVCECGIIVVLRRLISKGVPPASCLAYMLAGPTVNIIVIGSTWAAFVAHGIAVQIVTSRVLLAIVTAIVTSYVVHVLFKDKVLDYVKNVHLRDQNITAVTTSTSNGSDVTQPQRMVRSPFSPRILNAARCGLNDFVDIMVFLIIGAAAASLVKLYIDIENVSSEYNSLLLIPLMMITAFLMSLCSEADAFVIASFVGISTSAKVAFLVYGPMIDIKLFVMYNSMFRPAMITTIICGVTVTVAISCLMMSIVIGI